MFDAIHAMPWPMVLSGIIWSLALGFALGNYACSLIHRLPRGRLILDKKPYCGNCGTLLQVKDLFPVVSALLLRHRCRYCHEPYPVSHTWTELLVGVLMVFAFFKWNFGEQYILVTGIGIFAIILAAIEANEKQVMSRVLIWLVLTGMLNRTLIDHTIYEFAIGGFYGLILGAILFFKQIKPVGHVYSFPVPVQLMGAGGVIVGVHQLPLFIALYIVLAILFMGLSSLLKKRFVLTVPFGFAVMTVVMYSAA